MKRLLFLPSLFLCFAAAAQSAQKAATGYLPPRGEWLHRSPGALGLDSAALQAAIGFARAMESKAPRDQELAQAESFGREPFDEGIGPFRERGDATGLIIYK